MLAFAACHVKRRDVKRSQRGLTSVSIAKRLLRFGPHFDFIVFVSGQNALGRVVL